MSNIPDAEQRETNASAKRKWTRKEKYVFLPFVVLAPVLLFVIVLAAIDVYMHNRDFDGRYGLNTLNVWGYRGDVAPPATDDQLRIAVVGGSTAWGYGVPVEESMPFLLQEALEQSGAAEDAVVLNLAYNNEGAFAYTANLEDYLKLDYDVVVMYTGVNDSGGENRLAWRRSSPIFRTIGYLPILPDLMNQILNNWRSGRGLANPEDPKIVFAERYQEELRDLVVDGEIEQYLETQRTEADTSSSPASSPDSEEESIDGLATSSDLCAEPWTFYCSQIARAIDFARVHGKLVLVVGEPFVSKAQADQQRQLRQFLEARYPSDPSITYADFGLAIDVTDPAIAFDGMHLTAEGNRSVAEQLVAPLRLLIDSNNQN